MMLMKMLTYYIYRAPEVQKVQSFPITLFDGTGSMHKEYPRAVNAYKIVFGDLGKKKLEYQWTKDLNPLEPFRQAGSGNITNTFVTMFQMLLSEKAKFPKNITLVFISDGKEEFELEKLTLFIERMKQKYLIQFISVAVGDQFPNSISNTLRSLIHNHDPTCPPLFQVTRSQTKSFTQIQAEFEAIFWEIRKRLLVSGELICINIPVYYTVSAKQQQNQVVANSLFLVEKNQKVIIDGQELQPTTNPSDIYQMILNSVQQAFISQGQIKFQEAQQEFEQILVGCQDLLNQIDKSKLQEFTDEQKNAENKVISALNVAQQIASGQLDLSNVKEYDLTSLQDYLVNNTQKFTELATNLKKTQAKAAPSKPSVAKAVKRVSQFIVKTTESDRETTPQKKIIPKAKLTASQKSIETTQSLHSEASQASKNQVQEQKPQQDETQQQESENKQELDTLLDQVEIYPQTNDLQAQEPIDLENNNENNDGSNQKKEEDLDLKQFVAEVDDKINDQVQNQEVDDSNKNKTENNLNENSSKSNVNDDQQNQQNNDDSLKNGVQTELEPQKQETENNNDQQLKESSDKIGNNSQENLEQHQQTVSLTQELDQKTECQSQEQQLDDGKNKDQNQEKMGDKNLEEGKNNQYQEAEQKQEEKPSQEQQERDYNNSNDLDDNNLNAGKQENDQNDINQLESQMPQENENQESLEKPVQDLIIQESIVREPEQAEELVDLQCGQEFILNAAQNHNLDLFNNNIQVEQQTNVVENENQLNTGNEKIQQFEAVIPQILNSFIVWNDQMLFKMSPVKALCQKNNNHITCIKEGWLLLEFIPLSKDNGECNLLNEQKQEYELEVKQIGNVLLTKPKVYKENTEFNIVLISQMKKKLQLVKKSIEFILSLSNVDDDNIYSVILTQGDFLTMLELIRYSLPFLMSWNHFCEPQFQ